MTNDEKYFIDLMSRTYSNKHEFIYNGYIVAAPKIDTINCWLFTIISLFIFCIMFNTFTFAFIGVILSFNQLEVTPSIGNSLAG